MDTNYSDYLQQVEKASTPDPDAGSCEHCGGGLAHYPECVSVVREPSGPRWLNHGSKDLTGQVKV